MWQNWRLLTENASLFRCKNCLCWKVQAADPHKLAQTSKLRFLGVFRLWWWTKSHLGWTHGLNILFCVFRVFYPNLMHNTRRKQANQRFVYFSQNRFCDQAWSLKLENINILMTWACRSYRKNTVWKSWKTSFRVLWSTKNEEKT